MRRLLLVILTISAFSTSSIALPSLGNKIIGGQSVVITQYPYQLALELDGKQVCGATLIETNIAVTAASCIQNHNVRSFHIRAGSTFLEKNGELSSVYRIFEHPKYVDDKSFDYDVAVLVLDRSLPLSQNIQTIKLYEREAEIPSKTMAAVTGWGLLEDGSKPNRLRAVFVPKFDDYDCALNYFDRNISDRMICFGFPHGGKSACQDDNGGPVVVRGKLAGIVSFGEGCRLKGYPGVYTKVSHPEIYDFLDTFIAEQ